MLSFVIPTFKRPHLLPRAIESVLNQTERDFVLWVVDNHSQDETQEVVKQYQLKDSRVRYLENKDFIGATANFQFGLQAVETPLVSFLSDDDYLAPNFLADCLACFSAHPEIAFAGGGGCFVDARGNTRAFLGKAPADGYYQNPQGFFAYVQSMFYPIFGALIFKTEIIKKIGFDRRLVTGLDQDIIGRCAASYPVYYLCSKDYYFFFENPVALSKQKNIALHEKETRILHENLNQLEWTAEEQAWLEDFLKKRLIKIFSDAFKHYLSNKDFSSAYRYAKKTRGLSQSLKNLGWMCQARLFLIFPFLMSSYQFLKAKERSIRTFFSKRRAKRLTS